MADKDLKVRIRADDSGFKATMSGASRDVETFGSKVNTLGTVFRSLRGTLAGLGATIGAGYFGNLIKQTIDAQDELRKMAASANVSVETLSALQYAAELGGVENERLVKSLQQINRNMLNAAIPTGEQARAFSALGIATRDAHGALRPTEQVLFDLADAYQQSSDKGAVAALAMKLMGDAGADLIPMMENGRAGIVAMMDEARALGIVIDEQTAVASERFNDNLTRLSKSVDAVKIALANKMLPALVDITDAMAEAAKQGGLLESALAGIDRAASIALDMEGVAELDKLLEKRREVTDRIEGGGFFSRLNRKADEEYLAVLNKRINEINERMLERQRRTNEPPPGKQATAGGTAVDYMAFDRNKKWMEDEQKALKESLIAEEKKIQNAERFVENAQRQFEIIGMTRGETLRYEAATQNLNESQMALVQSIAASIDAQDERMVQLKDAIKQEEAYTEAIKKRKDAYSSVKSGLMTDDERRNADFFGKAGVISDAAGAGDISIEESREQMRRATAEWMEGEKTFAREWVETWKDASNQFTTNIGRAVADAVIDQKQFSDLLRGAARSMAREVIASLVSIGVQRAAMWVAEKLFLTSTTAAGVAAGATTAAAWAPAAAMVSLATLGGNAVPAMAGMGSTFAMAETLALAGMAHDGLDNVPRTGTYILEAGERVVKKEDNRRLEQFLNGQGTGQVNINFTITGKDAPSAAEIVASQKSRIIQIVQGAYDNRGRRGGPIT